jgi:cytochrome P450
VTAQCNRAALRPGSLGAAVFEAVDRGEVAEDEAALLVRSLLSAGLDTTVYGLGNALFALATHPEAWAQLHARPELARAAFEEALRFESSVQTFFRTTTRETELGGVALPADAKILLFLGAANRDPRRWDEPDRFDIGRKSSGHVAFGYGIHSCVGQAVARMEGEIVPAGAGRAYRAARPLRRPRSGGSTTRSAAWPACRCASRRGEPGPGKLGRPGVGRAAVGRRQRPGAASRPLNPSRVRMAWSRSVQV